ncbi:EAL domain-containing protein [Pseudoalteromonas sp. SR43-6]|uniref:bifunctional diguanylate cyclase/phosphodiesterase n=1 Tax=unclassified Pseudoalteromonas TaxID=194690 RepID=UPI0015FC5056|nr:MULTISPECIES: EAL domain-containing protein [unclassified Pseudoalteromonas]MBB1290464.1 EAL domain-containing protein [Pseudoalteromonas sp. SR41-5]MBB1372810.1 EAL domain-containing protein [Pseudoalteromonas sp. SR43-6]MBB1412701.1 EAL domain-containing protein [Pseudoalteromonas sp. SG43-8]
MSRLFKNGLSLKTQVYGLIILISVLSFFVRVITDVDTTRQYLQTQMGSHAQDTATSLGLSISPYLEEDSLMIAQTMATAIFDSGYYKQIKFTNADNKIVFDLTSPKRVESVPNWFITAVKLKAPTMQSELNNGWIIAGVLEVTSHVGQSYLTLWEHTKRSFYGSLFLLVASLAVAYLILRAVFKPLKAVENQAHLVTRKRFTLNDEIPVARELRTVTRAINNMVMNLQSTFDSLTKQTQALTDEVYVDSLTGLGNRRSFENHFNSVVDAITSDTPITAMMVTLPSLTNINQTVSYQDGDEHVHDVSVTLQNVFGALTNSKIFRLNGSTFIALVPFDIQFLNRTRLDINDAFSKKKNSLHVNGFANLALVNVDKGSSIGGVLSALDTGCTIGDTAINNKVDKDTLFSVKEWRSLIQSIIATGEVSFSVQPVKRTNSQNKQCYFEVFAHFTHEGEKVNNGHLFAMAEKLNLTEELDKKIIRNFVNVKEQHPDDTFALNISKASLYSTDFIEWLTLYAHTKPIIKTNLIFELHEISLLYNVHVASLHIDTIKDIGINVCVEHFGTSLTSFRYLQGLDIEYIKIDGSYIQDLLDNTQSQFFIQTVNNICHGFGIKVLACLIEKPETLKVLESLGCDGVQGNLIMPPTKIIKTSDNGVNKEFTFCTDALKFCN